MIPTSLDEALLEQWAIQVKRSPVPVIVSMGLVAYMASQYVSPWYWCTWWLLVVAVQVLRVVTYLRLPARTDLSVETRVRIVVAINMAGTLVHSLSLAWFSLFTPFEAAVQSILFIGMGVGSVMTCAGYRPFARAHAFCGLAPMFALWIWIGFNGDGGAIALTVGCIGLFGYMPVLLRISENIFDLYRDSFENRQQLQVALEQAEAAGRAKTRFLASASHDLRQPMHALSLFGAALENRDLDQETRDIVDNINGSVEALSYELDGLLDISKLDAGIVTVNPGHFCLYNMLQRIQDEFSRLAHLKSISIHLEGPTRSIVHTDGALLERIIRNLVTNAINHNAACELYMRILDENGGWRLEVEDTGRGITPSQHDHVFEEFYQIDNPERDRTRGLGLGLSIVRRLSELLDVSMEFDSVPGRGTKFTFLLDAVDVELPEEADEELPFHADELLRSLVVLVVDDEKAVREGMHALLASLGCKILAADGTESAIEAATSKEPDIVLVDFRLRGQDSGLLAIEQLREAYPGLPAIIISGDTAPERLREIDRAAIPVLVKPVLMGPLKEAIIRNCFPDASRVAAGTVA